MCARRNGELAEIPWEAMIIEGHEGGAGAEFLEHLNGFGRRVSFRIAAFEQVRDGDSGARFGAVLVKSSS